MIAETDNRQFPTSMAERASIEIRSFGRVFRLTDVNSPIEKTILWVLLAVWGTITIGIAFGFAESTTVYSGLTALVWALVGRVWGQEAVKMAGGMGGDE